MSPVSTLIGLLLAGATASQACASGRDIKTQLLKLDPRTRLEQACDTEAMVRIKGSDHSLRPDKVIAYSFKEPSYGKDSLTAPGAVFRSRGEWYHLSYRCQTEPQHVEVRKLEFAVGGKVARENWDKYFLYD